MTPKNVATACLCALLCATGAAQANEPPGPQELCIIAGPQTPRDIASKTGLNQIRWPAAPAPSGMYLCDIHTHANAQHKGPGFDRLPASADPGGHVCNEAAPAESAPDHAGDGHGVRPGETIEAHWVFTSCAVTPGPGLGSCLCDKDPSGGNPELRVEALVFLAVDDTDALDFGVFDYAGATVGLPQPKALPTGTGDPVVFLGSTTEPAFNSSDTCSPFDVTWSVRRNAPGSTQPRSTPGSRSRATPRAGAPTARSTRSGSTTATACASW